MKIEQLMTKAVSTCRPDETLDAAAHRMWQADCGCLPVTEADGSGRVLGMLSDRDICMAAHFRGRSLHEIRVGDAMAREVRACNPGDSLAEAEAIMCEARVRRLPVVDSAEQLLGIISLADLAREAARERGAKKRKQVSETEIGGTLAAICEPRPPREEVALREGSG